MNFLAKLLLGDGRLSAELRARLDAEGLVLIEEGLAGSVRYHRFKAPGRFHHGKITPVRMGLAISKERLVVYCRSGRAKLVDSPFTNPRLGMVDVVLRDEDSLEIRIDYDRGDVPRVSGQVTIVVKTPNAASVVGEFSARLGNAA